MKKSGRLAVVTMLVLGLLLVGGIIYAVQGIPITIDGKAVESDVAPQLVDGRTLVPLRVISENFGADVHWLQDERSVQIVSPYKKFTDGLMDKGNYLMEATTVYARYTQNKSSVIILDVRPPAARASMGRIQGDINIPLPTLVERIDELPAGTPIAVYCARDVMSSYATMILNILGKEAYVMPGGMNAWAEAGGAIATNDIVDTAVAAGSFNTLAAALEAADLIGALKGEGPFTVFAPTDDAFAALPEGTLEALLADIPTLTEILLYHVVAGEVVAADVVAAAPFEATTLQGSTASVTVADGAVYVDSAQVIATDIFCTNGVIHVIDAVILP